MPFEGSTAQPRSAEHGAPAWRAITTGAFPFLAALYLALYAAYGTESPFFPLFLATRGLSAEAIGLFVAAGTLVRLATGPLVGVAADVFGTRRVLALTAIGAGTVICLYLAARGFWPLLAVCLVHAVALGPLSPLADALALNASRTGAFAYGWVRGLGSAAFILGTLASGILVAAFGIDAIIVAAAVLFLAMPAPLPFVPAPPAAAPAAARGALATLLAIAPYRRLLVVAGLVIGSHAMSDTFAIIHWRAHGVSAPMTGVLWSEAVGSEIVVFILVGPWLLARLGPGRAAALSAAAGVLRWAVFASTSNVFAIGGAQLLHGLTFSLMHLVGMRIVSTRVPADLSSTAQTFYGTFAIGVATAVLAVLSGEIFSLLGASAFWLMGALCALAFALVRGMEG